MRGDVLRAFPGGARNAVRNLAFALTSQIVDRTGQSDNTAGSPVYTRRDLLLGVELAWSE